MAATFDPWALSSWALEPVLVFPGGQADWVKHC